MNLAKISERGRLTLPKEIRESLQLKQGDKILFYENKKGEIVIINASVKKLPLQYQKI